MSASELDKAIEAGDMAEVKRLVEGGADLSHMGAYDSTPLANAVFWNQEEIVAFLLAAGAEPDDGGCSSPLVDACGKRSLRMCKMLLEAGGDPDDGDTEGRRPIDVAVFVGRRDLVELLISYGAKEFDVDQLLMVAEDKNEHGSHDEVIAYLKEVAKAT